MHLPALGQANVHETAEVKKREQLPATKEKGDSSSSSRAVEKLYLHDRNNCHITLLYATKSYSLERKVAIFRIRGLRVKILIVRNCGRALKRGKNTL